MKKGWRLAFEFVVFGAGTVLCIVWYDFRLFLVLMLLMWGNNLMLKRELEGYPE